eukprot:GHUV01005745.1.p1 GENE.GHUV01005745.1~~GHUV01005745.1.p1  ORF type:complete len:279 (+),score=73.59 GHUV01005745.1:329-1165(+)
MFSCHQLTRAPVYGTAGRQPRNAGLISLGHCRVERSDQHSTRRHQLPTCRARPVMNASERLPLLCGLTGSIGMGKTTVSAMLTNHDVPVLSADAVVHQLYAAGGAAVQAVGAAFPSAVTDGAVDRTALSRCVVGNEAAMQQLEAIVHPLVEAERVKFVQQHSSQGSPLLIFDIPLLYETKAESGLDTVIVVSASPEQQHDRVMRRPGMTEEKLQAILSRQVPDAEKRKRADYVIDTGCSLEETEQQVVQVIQQLMSRKGTAAARLMQSSKIVAPVEDD